MSMFKKLRVPVISASALFTVAAGFHYGPGILLPQEAGREHLEERGYTVTGKGKLDFFNFCGEDVSARRFPVEWQDQQKDGTTEYKEGEKTICYYAPFGTLVKLQPFHK